MRKCKLCGQDILKWHSYQISGTEVIHLTCARGDKPASAPGDRWTGDRNLMLVPAKKLITEGKAMEREDE